METDLNRVYRQLPQVGEFLDAPAATELLRLYPRPLVLAAVRDVLADLRNEIGRGALTEDTLQFELEHLHEHVASSLLDRRRSALRPVINATGVILQTNLGRAPLSDSAMEQIAAVARGYCNLEFDLETGERGRRGAYVERLLVQLVGSDLRERAALVVNNCAAAAFLALNTLAEGGEVIVSRGELVEIGGGFRVPEILRKSGARLVEVGTTNRTRIEDYAAAITAETRLILRVHRSNFEIVGFTEEPQLRELVQLGTDSGVPVVFDQGTGCVAPLEDYGLVQQSSFLASAGSGAALVCASGDKLFGGPQCGLLVGEQALVRRLRANPLYRALRVDKLSLAALQATLLEYLSNQLESIPAIHMLGLRAEEIRTRCEGWAARLSSESIRAEVVPTANVVGGGTTPNATLPSFAIGLQAKATSADRLAALLRDLDPPVITRIHEGQVLLDLRTVPEHEDEALPGVICEQLHARLAAGGDPHEDAAR
jgi:L-seryl-tRNA(Ser) seleniumtransferase